MDPIGGKDAKGTRQLLVIPATQLRRLSYRFERNQVSFSDARV